jgi:hypothetical protein
MPEAKLQQTIQKLPPRTPHEVLSALVRAVASVGPVGPVVLEFRSGSRITGNILSGQWKQEALLAVMVQPQGNDQGVTYFYPELLASITVLNMELAVEHLGFGKTDSLDLKTAPSKLQLQRQLSATLEELKKSWEGKIAFHFEDKTFPWTDERSGLGLADFLGVLKEAAATLWADALARETLSQKVKAVQIVGGESQEIGMKNGTLSLRIHFTASRPERFTAHTLVQAIEAIF